MQPYSPRTYLFDRPTDELIGFLPLTYAHTTDAAALAQFIYDALPPFDGYNYAKMSSGVKFQDASDLAAQIALRPGTMLDAHHRTAAAVALRVIAKFGPAHGPGPVSTVYLGRTDRDLFADPLPARDFESDPARRPETEVDLWYYEHAEVIFAVGAHGFVAGCDTSDTDPAGYAYNGMRRVRGGNWMLLF